MELPASDVAQILQVDDARFVSSGASRLGHRDIPTVKSPRSAPSVTSVRIAHGRERSGAIPIGKQSRLDGSASQCRTPTDPAGGGGQLLARPPPRPPRRDATRRRRSGAQEIASRAMAAATVSQHQFTDPPRPAQRSRTGRRRWLPTAAEPRGRRTSSVSTGPGLRRRHTNRGHTTRTDNRWNRSLPAQTDGHWARSRERGCPW